MPWAQSLDTIFRGAIAGLVPQILRADQVDPSTLSSSQVSVLPLSPKLRRFLDAARDRLGQSFPKDKSRFRTLLYGRIQQSAIQIWLEQETGLHCWEEILELCNRLDTMTIENRPIAKTIVISQELAHAPDENKRINLADPNLDRVIAFVGSKPSTYIKVNPMLDFTGYKGIEPVDEGQKSFAKILPDSLLPLSANLGTEAQAEYFVARTGSGDIFIGHSKGLLATRLRHQWKVIDGAHLNTTAATVLGAEKQFSNLTYVLFQVALDHAMHRHGALLVVDEATAFDKYTKGGMRRNTPSQLSQILPNCSFNSTAIDRTEVKRLIELSAIDGAVLIDLSGEVQACGAIISPESHSSPEGARTVAARSAAIAGGVVWKVSSDGGLGFFFQDSTLGPGVYEMRL